MRIKKIDLLISRSFKVEQIYKYFLGNDVNIKTINPTVSHIESISPSKMMEIRYPIKFATLNGCVSVAKGAYLILDTLKILKLKAKINYFELHIYGYILDGLEQKISSYPNVFYHGTYKLDELNTLFKGIHVGIIPSIWEEVYGYIGLEFLSKGIPIIGNNRGGIVDYTVDGLTGFINKDATAEGLSDIIIKLIENPATILNLSNYIVKNRDKILKTMHKHLKEMDYIYKDLIDIYNGK
jgi:glycosyltransferase involved in cell wall biosynthesis